MSAGDHLSPQQFPVPTEMRDINGSPHQFVGWHTHDGPTMAHDPEHEHFDDALGAGTGALYVTHDPKYWGRFMANRSHATEVWAKTSGHDPRHLHQMHDLEMHEDAYDANEPVHLGRTAPIHEVAAHAATYMHPNTRVQSLLLGPKAERSVFVPGRGAVPVKTRAVK